jgi:ABC transport system ATP-binding/permease protein
MTLLRAANLSLAFGSRTVFDRLTFTIEESERVGLVGVNGSGKSTLMKILVGAIQADGGQIQRRRRARIALLPQELAFLSASTPAGLTSPSRQLIFSSAWTDTKRVLGSPTAAFSPGSRKRGRFCHYIVG